ncbi:MAG TPA: hypothetical protein VLM79_17570, partial [Kofleriaceae bacterium]|nr:hypothetical protein [Kofleriaceae bacterium]
MQLAELGVHNAEIHLDPEVRRSGGVIDPGRPFVVCARPLEVVALELEPAPVVLGPRHRFIVGATRDDPRRQNLAQQGFGLREVLALDLDIRLGLERVDQPRTPGSHERAPDRHGLALCRERPVELPLAKQTDGECVEPARPHARGLTGAHQGELDVRASRERLRRPSDVLRKDKEALHEHIGEQHIVVRGCCRRRSALVRCERFAEPAQPLLTFSDERERASFERNPSRSLPGVGGGLCERERAFVLVELVERLGAREVRLRRRDRVAGWGTDGARNRLVWVVAIGDRAQPVDDTRGAAQLRGRGIEQAIDNSAELDEILVETAHLAVELLGRSEALVRVCARGRAAREPRCAVLLEGCDDPIGDRVGLSRGKHALAQLLRFRRIPRALQRCVESSTDRVVARRSHDRDHCGGRDGRDRDDRD